MLTKRLTISALAVVLASPAYAVDAPQTYTITVTADELNVVGDALTYEPKRLADPLLQKLSDQVKAQVDAAKPKPPAPASAPSK